MLQARRTPKTLEVVVEECKGRPCGGKDQCRWQRQKTVVAEEKVNRAVFAGACDVTDQFDVLLKKFALWKTLRV